MQVPLTFDPGPTWAGRTHTAMTSVVFTTVTSVSAVLLYGQTDERYDCVVQETCPYTVIVSFVCVHWEAAPRQCLPVSMLTCFLSVHGDKK